MEHAKARVRCALLTWRPPCTALIHPSCSPLPSTKPRPWQAVLGLAPRARMASGSFFFFQAEDGIRDWSVTGVQTCALPIYVRAACRAHIGYFLRHWSHVKDAFDPVLERWIDNFMRPGNLQGGFNWYISQNEIGRASCRERV